MNRLASTGETAEPCGVPRTRSTTAPPGCCNGAASQRLTQSITQPGAPTAPTALAHQIPRNAVEERLDIQVYHPAPAPAPPPAGRDRIDRATTRAITVGAGRKTGSAAFPSTMAAAVWATRSATVGTPRTLVPACGSGTSTILTAGGKQPPRTPDSRSCTGCLPGLPRTPPPSTHPPPTLPYCLLLLTRCHAPITSCLEISKDLPPGTSDSDLLISSSSQRPGRPTRTHHERPSPLAPLPLQEPRRYHEPVRQHPTTRAPSPVSHRPSRPGSRRQHRRTPPGRHCGHTAGLIPGTPSNPGSDAIQASRRINSGSLTLVFPTPT